MQRCLFFIGRCTPSQTYTKTKAHLHFQFVVFKSCESCFVINEQPWVSNVHSKICIFYYVNIFTVCDVNRKWYCNGAEFATVTGTYQLEVRHKEVHYNSKENFPWGFSEFNIVWHNKFEFALRLSSFLSKMSLLGICAIGVIKIYEIFLSCAKVTDFYDKVFF